MPKAQREQRERTDNYHLILQWCRTPEQRLYEGIRPITLFGLPLPNAPKRPESQKARYVGLLLLSIRTA